MEVISAKVDKRTKNRMKRFPDINWSEVIREAIIRKLREEELRRKINPVNREELVKAAKATDMLRSKQAAISENESWNSVEEIRRWRERRRY